VEEFIETNLTEGIIEMNLKWIQMSLLHLMYSSRLSVWHLIITWYF